MNDSAEGASKRTAHERQTRAADGGGGGSAELPLSSWSLDMVASWLEDLKSQNNLHFQVDDVAVEGRILAKMSQDQLIQLSKNTKAGITIFPAKVRD